MSVLFRSKPALLLTLLLYTILSSGQNKQANEYRIVFYNTENLFDPFDDPKTNDGEFTPTGKCHWTISRLNYKIKMVYSAIISASDGHFPDIIGLAEIENLWVLEYLIKNTPLKEGNYGIIHKESPDPRGIDVALLYRKTTVVPVDYDFIPVHGGGDSHFSSRDVLLFKAKLNNEVVNFFVNHWPSRSGGYIETLGKRNIAARIVRRTIDSLRTEVPQCKL
jgi:predicted extracellular nuclease